MRYVYILLTILWQKIRGTELFFFSGLPQQQGISLNRKESKGHINPVIEKNEAQGFIAWGRAIEKLAPSSSNKETL